MSVFENALINIHCHSRRSRRDVEIVSIDSAEIPTLSGKPSATAELTAAIGNHDQAEIRDYFSVGLHPWFIAERNIDDAMRSIASAAAHPDLLAIGECGLDRCIATPMAAQIDVFIRQIQIAEQFGKPIIIHCVRAFDELLRIKKQIATIQPWIIHGFTGKQALAEQLIKHGCYLSFGKILLNIDNPVIRTLKSIPIDRLFLETDAASDVNIGEIYASAAKILDLDDATLQRHIVANFKRVFFHD